MKHIIKKFAIRCIYGNEEDCRTMSLQSVTDSVGPAVIKCARPSWITLTQPYHL